MIRYLERNLPPLEAGTTSPPIAFMLRVGPWMIDNHGLHREYRSVSKDGKIIKRRWKTLTPNQQRQ
jgi:hypothetical protein